MKEKHNAVSFNLLADNILGHAHRNSDDVLSDVVRGHDPLLGGGIGRNSGKFKETAIVSFGHILSLITHGVNILSLTPPTWEYGTGA